MMEKKIKRNYMFLFCAIIFVIFIFKHSLVPLGMNDDSWFLNMANSMNLLDYLAMRYSNWTSRLVIEAIMLTLLKLPNVIWIVLDSLMFVLTYYSIIKILNSKDNLWVNIFVTLLLITFPFNYFGSAGWYATTINYAWPLGLGFYVLSYIPTFFQGEKVKKVNYLLLAGSLLVATSQEQMCALIFGFFLTSFIYYWYNNKKVDYRIISILTFSALILLFHALCPGNGLRKISETATFYPEYANFTLFDKIILGVLSTTSYIIANWEWITILFFIIISYKALKKLTKKEFIISLIPLISYMTAFVSVHFNRDGFVSYVISRYLGNLGTIPYDIYMVLYIVIILFESFCIAYVIYRLLDLKSFLIVSVVLCAALASRFILGFSASIFASGTRTFINMFMLFIVADTMILFDEIVYLKKEEI